MKAKKLITAAVVGNVAGVGLTYVALTAAPPFFGRQLCYCLFLFLCFPLGWLGALLSKMSATSGIALLYFWGGVTINACLWGWAVSRITRAVQQRRGIAHKGFDALPITQQIAQVRREHAAAAHARSHLLYSRKGLLAAARRAVMRCGYFSGVGAERAEPAEQKTPKSEP